MKNVKPLLFLALGMLAFAGREGNFTIRFEPTAILQAEAQVPFQITVADDLRKPVSEAKVTLQIETKDGRNVQVFKAPAIAAGVYLAKPVFPQPGPWNISVEVHRNEDSSTRTMEFTVAK
jgi:hypothetical protein